MEIIFQGKSILGYLYDLITKYFIYYKETPLENNRKFVCHVTDSVIVHISQSCVREDNKNVTLDM